MDKKMCGEIFHEFDDRSLVCQCGLDMWIPDSLDDDDDPMAKDYDEGGAQ